MSSVSTVLDNLWVPDYIREPELSFDQRFSIVGKTGSGKTWFAIVLLSLLVPWQKKRDSSHAEVWFIDTKHDPKDIELLQRWGFQYGGKSNYRLFSVYPTAPERSGKKIIPGKKQWESAQEIIAAAYNYSGVLVVVDEYVQVVRNTIDAGPGLLDVFQRGRGLNVGIIGLTQEPVYVPRQLLSQASHQFFFDMSYPNDIKRIWEFYAQYKRPISRGLEFKHGFYHIAVDYDGFGVFYPHYKEWVEQNGLLERLAA